MESRRRSERVQKEWVCIAPGASTSTLYTDARVLLFLASCHSSCFFDCDFLGSVSRRCKCPNAQISDSESRHRLCRSLSQTVQRSSAHQRRQCCLLLGNDSGRADCPAAEAEFRRTAADAQSGRDRFRPGGGRYGGQDEGQVL
jgi:hypothetical protein